MYNLIECRDNYSKTSGSFGNTVEINQLWLMLRLLLIVLMILTILSLDLKKHLKTATDDTKNIYLNNGTIKIFK